VQLIITIVSLIRSYPTELAWVLLTFCLLVFVLLPIELKRR